MYIKTRIEDGFMFVANVEGEIVGFITGSIQKSLPFKTYSHYGLLENMFIQESYQRKGIEDQLVDNFVLKCKESNINYIHTDSDANQLLIILK